MTTEASELDDSSCTMHGWRWTYCKVRGLFLLCASAVDYNALKHSKQQAHALLPVRTYHLVEQRYVK